RTEATPGLKLRWPTPLESAAILSVAEVRQFEFGEVGQGDDGSTQPADENAIQTRDNNVVDVSYSVQYRVGNAYSFVYGMENAVTTLGDAAQAAVREVVGRKNVDQVLYSSRSQIQAEAGTVLGEILVSYFDGVPENSPFEILQVQLQVVQPPAAVQQAFDDVIAAQQDEARVLSEARGDAEVVGHRAAATATELREAAQAYELVVVEHAKGESARFEAVLEEYWLAPSVTGRRLYLETMEEILPRAEKVIIEAGAAQVLPLLPLGSGNGAGQRKSAAGPGAAGSSATLNSEAPASGDAAEPLR
ncbi:MAG: FtsH protease activity modulator HflK, partial [Myxococcota bacterium]